MAAHDDFQVDTRKQEGEASVSLPEDLVQGIVARVPFPFLLKARELSKSWLARFSPVSPQDDEAKRDIATSFQKRVAEQSCTWKTFCPVFVCKNDMKFWTYDRASCTWRCIPALSFLPENFLTTFKRPKLHIEGALVLVESTSREPKSRELSRNNWRVAPRLGDWIPGEFDFCVANTFTRSWKQLPPRPRMDPDHIDEKLNFRDAKLVSHTSSGTYKVVVFYIFVGHCLARIYESESNSWSCKRFSTSEDYAFPSNCAYLHGVLYRIVRCCEMAWGLLAFDVEEGAFRVLQMPPIDEKIKFTDSELIICNGSLLLVVYSSYFTVESVMLLRIDLASRRWVIVTRGPPAALNFGNLEKHPASDGDCLFFASARYAGGMLKYNLHKDEWSSFPCPRIFNLTLAQADSPFALPMEFHSIASSFQPGLNSFLAV